MLATKPAAKITRAVERMMVMIHHLDDHHKALFVPTLPNSLSENARLPVLQAPRNNEAMRKLVVQ
jgi:hypothetical protein